VVLPARVPLDEMNSATAFGAEASQRMNLKEADLAPEIELNDIVWRSIRGADSPMPPPRRAAFIRPLADDDREKDRDNEDKENKEGLRERFRTPR
jgi:hypothetical protein